MFWSTGSPLPSPDAVPKLKSDRSFLPFAATFEALGYTGITWDGSTGTVTASRDGQRISLTIGEPSITLYTEEAPDGQNIPMDVAPYDGSRHGPHLCSCRADR